MLFTKQDTGTAGENNCCRQTGMDGGPPFSQGMKNMSPSQWWLSACVLGSLLLYKCLRLMKTQALDKWLIMTVNSSSLDIETERIKTTEYQIRVSGFKRNCVTKDEILSS